MTFIQEFSFNINKDNTVLPKYLIDGQVMSNCIVKIQYDNNNHTIYYIRCSIEKDYYLNNYDFHIKYNKEHDYYILNDYVGNTIEHVYDIEGDYNYIDEAIINKILINICGYVPKFYFGNTFNKIYSKINKYINNNLNKISKQFKNDIMKLENILCKIITMDDIQKYDNNLYKKIQYKFINLFIKLDNKEFIVYDIAYKIDSLNIEMVLLNSNVLNYN